MNSGVTVFLTLTVSSPEPVFSVTPGIPSACAWLTLKVFPPLPALIVRAPMSVVLTLADELDLSRGDALASGLPHVGSRFESDIVWMDERPLDPNRIYLLKHTTRTVTAEIDHGLVLNQIGSVTVSTARPIMFDRYVDNRGTGSFIVVDPATNFTAGAGMVAEVLPDRPGVRPTRSNVAERLARLARAANSEDEAIDAVRQELDALLA